MMYVIGECTQVLGRCNPILILFHTLHNITFFIFFSGSWLVPFSVLCLLNVVLGCLDFAGKFSVLHRYKIQQDKNVPVCKYL